MFDYTSSLAYLLKEGHHGFIVVGIKATWLDEPQFYGRNNDFLPKGTKFRLGPSDGNAENFLTYVKNEVIPYIETNYRTLPHRLGVGHPLSASFVVYGLLNAPSLFDNYIAISPNLSYDDQYLVKGLRDFDSNQFETQKYLYLSHANESIDTDFWPGWKEANEAAYPILQNDLPSKNLDVVTEVFPEKLHREGFIPALQSALTYYFNKIEPEQDKVLSKATYDITFRVTVPNEDDELYITGNQESLANWNPGKLKMDRISPFEREITIKAQDPVMAKFTRGSWESEAWLAIEDWQTNFLYTIRPETGKTYTAKIASYNDKR